MRIYDSMLVYFFLVYTVDRRIRFRPFIALGRVMGSLGGLTVIEHVILILCVCFILRDFFPIFSGYFLELIMSK